MMSIVSQLNQWVVDNNPLLLAFGLPALAVFGGFFGSYLVHRSKAMEIKLSGRTKLADLRMENFRELLNLIEELETLISAELFDVYLRRDTGGKVNAERLELIMTLARKAGVRISSEATNLDEFDEKVSACLSFLHNIRNGSAERKPIEDLRSYCRVVVRQERRQIEDELKRLG